MTGAFGAALTAVGTIGVLLLALRVQAWWVARSGVPAVASRKLGHLGLGTVLLASWSLFERFPGGGLWAALPPLVIGGYFIAVGTGTLQDIGAVRSATRSGDSGELGRGPALYCLAFVVLAAVWWRTPVAVVAACCLVYGDAAGEIAGRGWRTPRLPWNAAKSVGGMLAVFLVGWATAWGATTLFAAVGFLDPGATPPPFALGLAAAAAALAEGITRGDLDNLTVPAAVILAGALWF